jgi:hypothetical protein
MGSTLELTDVKNKLEDLSGVVVKPGENPYNALIEACHDDPVESPLSFSSMSFLIGHMRRRHARNRGGRPEEVYCYDRERRAWAR